MKCVPLGLPSSVKPPNACPYSHCVITPAQKDGSGFFVIEYAKRIKPVLLELDEQIPIHNGVDINGLKAVCETHANVKVSLFPIRIKSLNGLFVGGDKSAQVFYRACAHHADIDAHWACAECQLSRFVIAKELSHLFDLDDDKTGPGSATDALLQDLIKGEFSHTGTLADEMGILWALEMLVRFEHRKTVSGNGVLAPHPRLTKAISSDDYSDLARCYGVPNAIIKTAFAKSFNDHVRELRRIAGYPLS